jgi:hypothetical protein
VGGWLIALWLLVLLMVSVGGITRLTGSGSRSWVGAAALRYRR